MTLTDNITRILEAPGEVGLALGLTSGAMVGLCIELTTHIGKFGFFGNLRTMHFWSGPLSTSIFLGTTYYAGSKFYQHVHRNIVSSSFFGVFVGSVASSAFLKVPVAHSLKSAGGFACTAASIVYISSYFK